MSQLVTLINGQAYSFVDVSFDIAGITPIPGFNGCPIKSINYNASQQKTANYENSKYATSYSYGKMTFGGSVTFTLDAAELIRDIIYIPAIRERSLVAMPSASITLTFSVKGKINKTKIHNVVFLNENLSGSEGDDQFTVTCDFLASNITYGDIGGVGHLATLAEGAADIINFGDNQGSIV